MENTQIQRHLRLIVSALLCLLLLLPTSMAIAASATEANEKQEQSIAEESSGENAGEGVAAPDAAPAPNPEQSSGVPELEPETPPSAESDTQASNEENIAETKSDTTAARSADAANMVPSGTADPAELRTGKEDLVMKVADDKGVFHDVDSLGNVINWNVMNEHTKQIQIKVGYPVGNSQNRQLEVDIPAGYRILEMTGNHAWKAPSGIRKLGLSDEDNSKVSSVSLSASDGSAWPKAIPVGPMPPQENYFSPAVTKPAKNDGKILYTFNNNCDMITLTLTLGLDQSIMPHNALEVKMRSLEARQISGTSGLAKKLDTTATNLMVPLINSAQGTDTYGGSRVISGTLDAQNESKGKTAEFSTGYNYHAFSSASHNHWAETATFTVAYPAGVTFNGFQDKPISHAGNALAPKIKYVNTDFTVSGDSAIYEIPSGNGAGHMKATVTGNAKTGGTVTLEYKNVYMWHDGNSGTFYLYWTADINQNDSPIQWGDTVPFKASYIETSGALSGDSETASEKKTAVNIQIKKPEEFNIQVAGVDRTRQDWNGYAEGKFKYDYLLGSFVIRNHAPNSFENPLRYEFTFEDSLATRGVSLPGFKGNDFSNVVLTTNTGRTITLPGPFEVTNVNLHNAGFVFDSARLGLSDNEWIRTFQVDQSGLASSAIGSGYTYGSTSYYGRWQDGVEGNATAKVYAIDNPSLSSETATSHTRIGWTKSGAGSSTLRYFNKDNASNGTGSFHPTDTINFLGSLSAANVVNHTNDIVDPTAYVSLPEGIDLDLNSVQGMSQAGNHGKDSWVSLNLKSVRNWTDKKGTTWTTYGFKSFDKLDLVARANHGFSSVLQPAGFDTMQVRFSAVVNSSSPTHTGIAAQDILAWDLGQSAVSVTSSTDFTFLDKNDIAQKGTNYRLVGAVKSVSLNNVQKPGFNVSLGIRVEGDGGPFFTYSGLDSTIAGVSVDAPAELSLTYENDSASAYKAGSEIYLPIPKATKAYNNYFNNLEINDPVNVSNAQAPQWNASLTNPIKLDGFDTYYLLDSVYNTTPVPADGVPNNWEPITSDHWRSEKQMMQTDYAKVTMVKFIANKEIAAKASGNTTIRLAVDRGAKLGQINFWRSYQKGWREADGTGTWQYGAVVAAQPAKAGITGMLFFDAPARDGKKAAQNEDFNNAAPRVTAILKETSNAVAPLNLTMNEDGSFATLNADGKQYFLKAGNYTVTFTNNTKGAYYFTDVTPEIRSSANGWSMDVPQAAISADGLTATYAFTVDTNSTSSTEYVGVGMRTGTYTLTYDVNAPDAKLGEKGYAQETDVPYGKGIWDLASYDANTSKDGMPIRSGYVFDGWYNESSGSTLADSETITGNKTVYAKWVTAPVPPVTPPSGGGGFGGGDTVGPGGEPGGNDGSGGNGGPSGGTSGGSGGGSGGGGSDGGNTGGSGTGNNNGSGDSGNTGGGSGNNNGNNNGNGNGGGSGNGNGNTCPPTVVCPPAPNPPIIINPPGSSQPPIVVTPPTVNVNPPVVNVRPPDVNVYPSAGGGTSSANTTNTTNAVSPSSSANPANGTNPSASTSGTSNSSAATNASSTPDPYGSYDSNQQNANNRSLSYNDYNDLNEQGYNGSAEGHRAWALVNLIMCVVGAVLGLVAIILGVLRARDERDQEYRAQRERDQRVAYTSTPPRQDSNWERYYKEDKKRAAKRTRLIWLALSVLAGIAGVVVFILTENMKYPMILVDWWTILNGVILLIGALATVLVPMRRKYDEYHEEGERYETNSEVQATQAYAS